MRAIIAWIALWPALVSADDRSWSTGLIISFMNDALVLEHVSVPSASTSGTAYNATTTAPYHLERSSGSTWAAGFRSGVLWRDATMLAGIELMVAEGLSAQPTTLADVRGNAAVTSRGGELYDIDVILGPHRRFGALDVGGVAVVGARLFQTLPTLPNDFTTCVGGASGKNCHAFTQTAQPLLELRGRLDAWLSPHVTLGISAGVDVVHLGESFALELQIHLLPYDGGR